MTLFSARSAWVILITFAVAFMLNLLPLPPWLDRFQPDWMALVLIYWCMALPNRVGVGTGWLLGLALDTAQGALLGQHALAMAVVAYLTIRTHQRVRVFPLWQQAPSVLMLLLVNHLLVAWVYGIIGYPPRGFWYLAPALGGMLLWPWVFIVLRDLRRRFGVA